LTGFCRHRDRQVIANHFESHLIDYFGDNRVDFAGMMLEPAALGGR
jgi:hypothetical protein